MSPDFDHYLITRFNLFHPSFRSDVNEESWLDSRFELFTKYCVPSIKSQTNKNFNWLIFIDPGLPGKYKGQFRSILEGIQEFKLVELDSYTLEGIRAKIKLMAKKEYLITSRLDSDDILSENYIEEVQKLFKHQNQLLVNFNSGYFLNNQTNVLGKVANYQANPFMSFIESTENILTVFIDDHSKLKQFEPQVSIDEGSGQFWITLIHDSNLLNRFSGRPVFSKKIHFNFPALKSVYQPSLDLNFIYSLISYSLDRFIKALKSQVKWILKTFRISTKSMRCI